MVGEYTYSLYNYTHPLLVASKVFTYGHFYIRNCGSIYGFADKGRNVSFWMIGTNLRVSFYGNECVGRIFASLSPEDRLPFIDELPSLAAEFPFFRVD